VITEINNFVMDIHLDIIYIYMICRFIYRLNNLNLLSLLYTYKCCHLCDYILFLMT